VISLKDLTKELKQPVLLAFTLACVLACVLACTFVTASQSATLQVITEWDRLINFEEIL
jgi:uncharacterized membrane protein